MHKASPSGGKQVVPGIIARAGRSLANRLNYWFGPDQPQPVSAPEGTRLRAFDYPVSYNIQIQPRNQEAVSFEQLRGLADALDILRLFIEKCKDSVITVPWEFRLKKQAADSADWYRKKNHDDERIQELTRFFQSPDQEHEYTDWIRMLLEDMLVLDAATVCPVADASGTLLKRPGKPFALEVVDGATIARKIGVDGRSPAPPDVAYQQIIKGLPSVNFTRDQLIYKPRNLRVHKFFGYSPVEQIIMTINIGLRRQMHLLGYYTEGNVPEAIAQVPDTWNSDQIAEFQNWFDAALSGTENLGRRRRITFIPNCGKIDFTRDPKLTDPLDEWVVRVIAYAYGLSPQQFISMMNRATAEVSVEQAAAEGLMPILQWVKGLMDLIVRKYFGYDDVEFAWQTASTSTDPMVQAEIDKIYVSCGVLSIDEVRDALGKKAIGVNNAVITSAGLAPVEGNPSTTEDTKEHKGSPATT